MTPFTLSVAIMIGIVWSDVFFRIVRLLADRFLHATDRRGEPRRLLDV